MGLKGLSWAPERMNLEIAKHVVYLSLSSLSVCWPAIFRMLLANPFWPMYLKLIAITYSSRIVLVSNMLIGKDTFMMLFPLIKLRPMFLIK